MVVFLVLASLASSGLPVFIYIGNLLSVFTSFFAIIVSVFALPIYFVGDLTLYYNLMFVFLFTFLLMWFYFTFLK